MRARNASTLALLPLVLACQGTAGGVSGGSDASPMDGGSDGARDAKEDASDASTDGSPVRFATTRGLLPTSVKSLLLDPFVTYDESWGHFDSLDPTTDDECAPIVRELMSQSPIGIAGAVANVSLRGRCTQILAPLSGASKGSVDAEMWISLSDASGAPLPFPTHGLDASIKVELVPNYLPTQTPQDVYPLEPVSVSPISPSDSGALPVTIAGREWGLVAVSAVPFTQGGWFVVTLVSETGSFYLAGPEVVPTTTVSLLRPHFRAMTDADRAATAGYARVVRTHRTPPRRHLGAH
jgi:hypothetical protein